MYTSSSSLYFDLNVYVYVHIRAYACAASARALAIALAIVYIVDLLYILSRSTVDANEKVVFFKILCHARNEEEMAACCTNVYSRTYSVLHKVAS